MAILIDRMRNYSKLYNQKMPKRNLNLCIRKEKPDDQPTNQNHIQKPNIKQALLTFSDFIQPRINSDTWNIKVEKDDDANNYYRGINMNETEDIGEYYAYDPLIYGTNYEDFQVIMEKIKLDEIFKEQFLLSKVKQFPLVPDIDYDNFKTLYDSHQQKSFSL